MSTTEQTIAMRELQRCEKAVERSEKTLNDYKEQVKYWKEKLGGTPVK